MLGGSFIVVGVNDGVCQEVFTVWLEDSDDENLDEETSCFVCVTDRFVVEKDNSAKVSLHIYNWCY